MSARPIIGAAYQPPRSSAERYDASGAFRQYLPPLSGDAERLQAALLTSRETRRAAVLDRINGALLAVIGVALVALLAGGWL